MSPSLGDKPRLDRGEICHGFEVVKGAFTTAQAVCCRGGLFGRKEKKKKSWVKPKVLRGGRNNRSLRADGKKIHWGRVSQAQFEAFQKDSRVINTEPRPFLGTTRGDSSRPALYQGYCRGNGVLASRLDRKLDVLRKGGRKALQQENLTTTNCRKPYIFRGQENGRKEGTK